MKLIRGEVIREYASETRSLDQKEISLIALELLKFRQEERMKSGWPPRWSIEAEEELPGGELTGSALIGG